MTQAQASVALMPGLAALAASRTERKMCTARRNGVRWLSPTKTRAGELDGETGIVPVGSRKQEVASCKPPAVKEALQLRKKLGETEETEWMATACSSGASTLPRVAFVEVLPFAHETARNTSSDLSRNTQQRGGHEQLGIDSGHASVWK